jgi:hypothetical protein
LLGPVLNAAVAVSFGWRWAMAWPALLILAARVMVGRDADIIPWNPSAANRLDFVNGPIVLCGLILASAAPLWGAPVLAAGLALAVWGSARLLRSSAGSSRRYGTLCALYGLCLAFFGGAGLVALAVVESLGRGVVAASVVVGAGLVAWSVTGLRPTRWDARIGDTATIGLVLLTLALAGEVTSQLVRDHRTAALVLAVAAWTVGGLGMGLSYSRLFAEAFDDLPPDRVTTVATATAFAETAASAVGALAGAGLYSIRGDDAGITAGYAVLAVAAAATAALALRRGTPPDPR